MSGDDGDRRWAAAVGKATDAMAPCWTTGLGERGRYCVPTRFRQ